MTDSETPHYLVDLDLDLVTHLRLGHKDHKSLNSGNAVAFASNVLNLDIVLFSNFNRCSWSGSARVRSFFTSKQIFTVLRENLKIVYAISILAIPLLNPFALLGQFISAWISFLESMDHLERYRDIVPDFDDFKAIQCLPLFNSARINTLKAKREDILQRLEEEAVPYQTFSWYHLGLRLDVKSPGKMLENILGHIHIQEEVSMVPPLVLDPQPGEQVLDLCASPGSKTTQISQMMKNRGTVVANEPSLARIAPLRANCERLGAMNVAITRYDGRRFPRGAFDRVLVDAPCSSEGRERRGPGTLTKSSLKRSIGLQALQIGLLKNAIRLAKPGSTVIYSTCTYAPEENEIVVEKVLNEARLEKVSIPGLRECSGVTTWNDEPLNDELKKCARYYPHINDTGGFFVAKLIKNQERLSADGSL